MANQKPGLNMTSLESWLWEAACKIRGDVDAPKYKDYILPIIFLKRLSDVFYDPCCGSAGLLISGIGGISPLRMTFKAIA